MIRAAARVHALIQAARPLVHHPQATGSCLLILAPHLTNAAHTRRALRALHLHHIARGAIPVAETALARARAALHHALTAQATGFRIHHHAQVLAAAALAAAPPVVPPANPLYLGPVLTRMHAAAQALASLSRSSSP